ncbi:uncharacterized protein EDB91DRAFT_124951 [Suillus paluster]|uniref:uncharacterized protein n=1 Tax=Suillus paluster TaxID=48578 RepID=UPI001B876521|nr:uncharacterized protein EDB91DRAFT_124951 [Suillus paluster]KAG1724574.1 hypothetical protein EDB91DRAFT_124951 [Suillus paluster]
MMLSSPYDAHTPILGLTHVTVCKNLTMPVMLIVISVNSSMQPTLREREARYSHNLFAVAPGKSHPDLFPYPMSQFASRLLVDKVVSMDSFTAKEIADDLIKSEDAKDAGELGRPDLHGQCHPANEDFVLRTKIHLAPKDQRDMAPSYTYTMQHELAMLAENCPQVLLSPNHGLVHPGTDAVMFDASTSTMWLVQVTHGSHRPVSPHGLLFLLDVVWGSPYEPSPKHPFAPHLRHTGAT